MQLKTTTGPYLLMAGGAAVLILALASLRPPIFAAAAALFGLGFWSLRKLEVRWLNGPYLLLAAGALLLIAGFISFKLPMFVAAAAFIGLGLWTLRRVAVPAMSGPFLLWAGAAALLATGYVQAVRRFCSSSPRGLPSWALTPGCTSRTAADRASAARSRRGRHQRAQIPFPPHEVRARLLALRGGGGVVQLGHQRAVVVQQPHLVGAVLGVG